MTSQEVVVFGLFLTLFLALVYNRARDAQRSRLSHRRSDPATRAWLAGLPYLGSDIETKFPWQMYRQGSYWMYWEMKATADPTANTTRVEWSLLIEHDKFSSYYQIAP